MKKNIKNSQSFRFKPLPHKIIKIYIPTISYSHRSLKSNPRKGSTIFLVIIKRVNLRVSQVRNRRDTLFSKCLVYLPLCFQTIISVNHSIKCLTKKRNSIFLLIPLKKTIQQCSKTTSLFSASVLGQKIESWRRTVFPAAFASFSTTTVASW